MSSYLPKFVKAEFRLKLYHLPCRRIKLIYFEEATKVWKNFPILFDEIFSNVCVLLRIFELSTQLTLKFSLNFCFRICNCHYIDKIVFFESSCCTHPKVMTNMLKKVFNWSEVRLSEVTSYKIHTSRCTAIYIPEKEVE